MSQAEDLLNNLPTDTTYVVGDHVTIGSDRIMIVPDNLKKLGVGSDHEVNTIHFIGPRYSENGTDLSTMSIWVNYMRVDGYPDQSRCENVKVDSEDETKLHYDWVITRNVTETHGNLVVLVCAKSVDEAGFEQNHWNSERNNDFYVVEGLEVQESIISQYPDLVEYMLLRVATVENKTTKAAMLNYVEQYLDDDPSVIIENIEKVIAGYPIEQFVKDYLDDYVDICTTENRTLNGCYSGAYEMVSMEGVSEQATTEGYQLFDISTAVSEDKVTVTDVNTSSISITFEDYYYGSIYTTQRDLLDTIVSSVGKTIHLTCDAEYDSEMYSSIILNGTFSDGTTYYEKASIPGTTYCKVVIPATLTSLANVSLRFARKKSKYSLNDFKVNNIMLYIDGDGTHEKYTGGKPSPNPEHPQEIKSVGPEVTIRTTGKNMLGGLYFANYLAASGADAVIDTAAKTVTLTGNPNSKKFVYREFKDNTRYTFFLKGINNSAGYEAITNMRIVYTNGLWYSPTFNTDGSTNVFVTPEGYGVECIMGLFAAGAAIYDYEGFGIMEGVCTLEDFEAYKESSAKITLPDELRSIDDISDMIKKKDGKWGIERWISRKIFDGSESLGKSNNSATSQYKYTDNNIAHARALSTHYQVFTAYSSANDHLKPYLRTSAGVLWFEYTLGTIDTVEELKEFLITQNSNGTPVTVDYVMSEPTWEELDSDAQKALDNLEVYDDITHVIIESDIQPVVTSKYGTSHTGATIITQANEIEKLKEQISDINSVLESLMGNN